MREESNGLLRSLPPTLTLGKVREGERESRSSYVCRPVGRRARALAWLTGVSRSDLCVNFTPKHFRAGAALQLPLGLEVCGPRIEMEGA